ncbi:MAG TPA: hypothetical protein VF141_04800, partial [Chryseolinea sp.]
MKRLLKLFLFCIVFGEVNAQINRFYDEDSLRAILRDTPMDTTRVDVLNNLAGSYFFKRPDSTLFYAQQALALARKLNYTTGIQFGFFRSGEANRHLGNLVEAAKIQSEAIEFNRKVKNKNYEANSLGW